ncbi:hypothetical protein ABK040_009388 [Willaertia magna]
MKRKIADESVSFFRAVKDFFRKGFTPDNSYLQTLTPEQKAAQREVTRKRIKFLVYGFFGCLFSGIPLYRRYLGNEETRLDYNINSRLGHDVLEINKLKEEVKELKAKTVKSTMEELESGAITLEEIIKREQEKQNKNNLQYLFG